MNYGFITMNPGELCVLGRWDLESETVCDL